VVVAAAEGMSRGSSSYSERFSNVSRCFDKQQQQGSGSPADNSVSALRSRPEAAFD
jgi:hypothetical protein